MNNDPLAQLRDIHLPEPIGWWPPAPGWWLLALTVLVISAVAVYYLRRYLYKRNRYRKEALRELRNLRAKLAALETGAAVDELASLLRRVAIKTCGREKVAPLTGENWLRFLDDKGGTNQFTAGPGKVLGEGHYRPSVEADLDQLGLIIEKWIRGSRQC